MSQGREANQAAALQQYTLQGVRETGDELGRGSYAAVYTVQYKGLTCATKKLHQALYEQGIGYATRRFQEECAILSRLRHPNIVQLRSKILYAKIFHPTLYQQEYAVRRFREECELSRRLRHPNIVQFLGVYHQPDSILPALVMEYLPMTLAQCLDKYGVLPNEIGYSILKDIALALSYLHQHSPPAKQRQVTEKVHSFDGKWKEFLPPMPTARHSPAVFSKPSCLTVVGSVGCDKRLSSVEIFIPDTSRWHKASPAPSLLSIAHDNNCHPQQMLPC